MGHWAYLDLRAPPPGVVLPEEDEEARAGLESKNALPLFWLALLDESDLRGDWEAGLRAAFADPAGETPVPPLVVGWPTAVRRLRAAAARAPGRAPALAGMLRDWATALEALAARRPPVDRVELNVGEIGNFHADPASFLDELLRGVRLWHGAGAPPPAPDVRDPVQELGGYAPGGVPFPPGIPDWMPGRPVPGADAPARWWDSALVSVPLGALAVLGAGWFAGLPGAAAAVALYAGFEAWAAFRPRGPKPPR